MHDVLGHYEIREKLGSGGMGEVYLAEDVKLRREVALKVLPETMSADPQRRSRFLQEAHAASVLNHPNVSTIYEIGEAGDTVYIAMEYIQGKTLAQLIKQAPVDPETIIDIATQVADALDEAELRGVVHRCRRRDLPRCVLRAALKDTLRARRLPTCALPSTYPARSLHSARCARSGRDDMLVEARLDLGNSLSGCYPDSNRQHHTTGHDGCRILRCETRRSTTRRAVWSAG